MAEPNSPGSVRLVVGVGLLSAIIGGIAVFAVQRSRAVPEPVVVAPSVAPAVEVMVAAKDLPVGTMMDGETVAAGVVRKAVPHTEKPEKFLAAEEALLGKRLTRPYRAGEVLHPDDLSKPSGPAVPPGMNLISLPVGDPVAREMIGAGARVDVMKTVRIGDAPRTVLVLQDVLVVAAEPGSYLRRPLPGAPAFTFAVDRKQALLIELARAHKGYFSFVQLNPDDVKPRPPQNLDATTKFFAELPEPQDPPAAKPAPPVPDGMVAVSIESAWQEGAGFIGPGAKADVLAVATIDNQRKAFPILMDVLVVAVDTQVGPGREVTKKITITFAVDKSQAAVFELAKAKKCTLLPMLRCPDGSIAKPEAHDLNEVTKFLDAIPDPTLPDAPAPRAK